MGKEVAGPIQKGNRQCSIRCEGRGGKIPNLECIKCRCLVHSECAGIPDLISSSSFICPNCHQLYLERKKAETAGFPMKRVSSPCPRMIPMPPTYPSSSPQNPRILSQSFPRPGTGDKNMMLISLLNERSLPNKIPRYHPRVARLARAPLNILSPPKPFWMIRGPSQRCRSIFQMEKNLCKVPWNGIFGPSTSSPNYQLERGTSTVLSSQSFGQIRPPPPAAPSSHCRFVYRNKSSFGKAPPPPPLRSFATPVKIAPRPNPTVLDYTNPTNCQLILSLLRCPPPSLEPVPGELQASGGGSGASWSSPNLSSSLTSPSIFKVPRGRPPLAVNKSARGRAPNLISSSSSLPELGGTYGGVTITKVSAPPHPPPPQQRDSQSMYNRLQERLQTMMMDQQRLPLPVQTPTTIPSQFGEANNTLENLENEQEEQVDVIRMPRSGITLKIVKKRKMIEDDGNRNASPTLTLPSSPGGHGNPVP
ncbi:unnamed protein product [Orchesella dallaii]|uniref:Uncharacterized protein n=1 Tax=Orchesella dallaii TaxID=48710 RepID=A0ABP1R9K4_9HEXA